MKALTLFISHSIKAKGIHVFTEPTNVKKVRNKFNCGSNFPSRDVYILVLCEITK